MDFQKLEDFYFKHVVEADRFCPEGFINVSDVVPLNKEMVNREATTKDFTSDKEFIVAEFPDKLLLINTDFAVWLVPGITEDGPLTRGYIALNHTDELYPELAFQATGDYNQSVLILEALDMFLEQIQDNENTLKSYEDETQDS